MVKLGINTNNDCGSSSEETIKNIKDAGFEYIMVTFKQGNYEQIIEEALESGLKIAFAHLTTANALWTKGELNKKYMVSVKEQLEACAKYKIPIAILHPVRGNPSEIAVPPNEFGLSCVREIVEFAKSRGVKIALENLDKSSFRHFAYIMEKITDPNLGFCYDLGHHQLYFPNIDLLKRYGDRILAIHLHDNLMDWEFGYDYTRDLHLLPFDGKIDYAKAIKRLAKTPYDNAIMLEIHKKTCGEPHLYENVPVTEFLAEAKKRAERVAEMFEKCKNAQK